MQTAVVYVSKCGIFIFFIIDLTVAVIMSSQLPFPVIHFVDFVLVCHHKSNTLEFLFDIVLEQILFAHLFLFETLLFIGIVLFDQLGFSTQLVE